MPLPYLFLLILLTLGRPAQGGEPPTAPQLRLDSGSHQAVVKRISADAAGQKLLTVSYDKTARLWDSRDGRLLASFRIPIGNGNEGKLFAGAISPDGTQVAVTGLTGYGGQGTYNIYLFSTDGVLQRRLGGLTSVIFDLAFSVDGRRLGAVLERKGLRVFDTSNGTLLFNDADYGDRSNSVDVSTDGRWLTSCYDGYVRLYSPDGALLAKTKPTGGKQPFTARFSPDGQRVAVGFSDSTALAVLDAKDLRPLYAPDTTGLNNGSLISVAWSADGTRLFAAGTYDNAGESPILVWGQAGRGQRQRLPGSQNTIMDLRSLPGGAVAYAAAAPAWGVIEANGRPRWQSHGELVDTRDMFKGSFGLSTDGGRLAFGYENNGKSPARFDLVNRRLESLTAHDPALPVPAAVPGLSAWEDEYQPRLHGTALKLDEYEISRSAAAVADGGLVLGTEWNLRRYDRKGQAILNQPGPGPVDGVAVSGDGRLVLAAYGDGTLRWHRVDTGAELLAFYPHPDRKRWIVWTPGGYYDAAPGAERLLGWHVNRGADHAADFFPADRFRARFYRPDVIDRVLATLDESVALAQADEARGRTTTSTPLISALPPVVELVSPANGDSFNQTQLTVRYRLRSPADQPVTAVKILLDGRPLPTARGLGRQEADIQQQTVELPPRDLELAIIAENANGASEAARLKLHWAGQTAADTFTFKPKLYVLAVGTSAYQNPELKLRYPAKDAADFANALQGQAGGLYREVVVKTVLDGDHDAVLDGLDWLEKQVTDKDVAVAFFSGHGQNDRNGDYQYLPADADLDNLRRTAVPYHALLDTLKNLPGKVLAFVDTCFAGNVMGGRKGAEVDINKLVNDLSATENGLVVFAASARNQYSLEDSSWGNGAFTKALVEGINGRANYRGNGAITINMLDLYIAERVKEITGGKQTPTTAKPDSIADFPLAVSH